MYGLGKRSTVKQSTEEPSKEDAAAKEAFRVNIDAVPAPASVPATIKQQSVFLRVLGSNPPLAALVLSKLRVIDLLELRSTSRDAFAIVLNYMKRLLMQTPILSNPSLGRGFSDMDFCTSDALREKFIWDSHCIRANNAVSTTTMCFAV